jgi:succinoglycan biosynthesis transport protein ExoP
MNEPGSDLQKHAMDTWQVIRNRISLITLSFLLVFAAAAVLTYIMPRKYRGRVEMTIERQPNAINPFAATMDAGRGFTQEYVKTQTDTISKPTTLYPVVDKLELTKRWNLPSQAALGKIRGGLDVQSSLRSDFVTIEFYDQDSKLASDIANAVAEAYITQHIDIQRKQKQESLDVISKQITDQEQLRRDAQDRELAARRKAGITTEWLSNGSNTLQAGAEIKGSDQSMFLTREQQQLQAKNELRSLESEMEQIAKLTPDEIIAQSSGLRLENANFASNVATYQKYVLDLDTLKGSGLGNKHPSVVGLNNSIETTRGFILQAAQDHVKGLQGRIAATKGTIAALEGDAEVAKGEAMDKGESYNEYKRAKDEVAYIEQTLIQMRQKLLRRTSSASKLIKFPATIYAHAEPEGKPIQAQHPA